MPASHPKRTESRPSTGGTASADFPLRFWWPVHGCLRESGLSARNEREAATHVLRNFFWRREEGHAGTSGHLRLALFAAVQAQLRGDTPHSRSVGGYIFESTSIVPAQAENRMKWSIQGETPLERFSHRWGISLLEFALVELEQEAEALHSVDSFRRIRPFLDRDPVGDHSAKDITLRSIRTVRMRLRELLFRQIRMTLTDDNDFQAEWEALYG